MKQFLISFFFLISINLFGQVPFSSYESSYVGKTYNVLVSPTDSNELIFLEMFSLDKLSPSGGIIMDEFEHIVFTREVWEARNKYAEWAKTAKENNVQTFEKSMDYYSYTKGYFYYGGEWRFQLFVKLSFTYKVLDGKNLLIIRTGKMVDDKNEFITHGGFAIVFQNTNEIDKFIINTSADKLKEFKKQQNLFKD